MMPEEDEFPYAGELARDELCLLGYVIALLLGDRLPGSLGSGRARVVTYSPRTFLVGPDDTLYRLGTAKFSGMLDDPESHRLPRFAGQRVRMAEAIVEIRDRVPCAVVRLVYEMLRFDAQGRLDRRALLRQNAALVELVVGRVVGGEPTTSDDAVVEASNRFIAQGGRWQPSPALAQRIRRAALGELRCKRL